MKYYILYYIVIITILFSCVNKYKNDRNNTSINQTHEINKYPQEKYLKNIKQLTNGGDNAEAYFSFDNSKLVFQSNRMGS